MLNTAQILRAWRRAEDKKPRPSFFRDLGGEERVLKLIIGAVVIILSAVVVYNIIHYSLMPVEWQVTISTFILSIPFSFFTQVLLNVKAERIKRASNLQERLRKLYVDNYKNLRTPDKRDINNDVSKTDDFTSMLSERIKLLMDDSDLYDAYNDALQLYRETDDFYVKSDQNSVDDTKRVNRKMILSLELGNNLLNEVILKRLAEEGLDFRSYLLPMPLFIFVYLIGFLITLPLINSIFTGESHDIDVPLFRDESSIPLLAIQWGFLGGLVYTTISLITRFLRNDLSPRVYYVSSFRLLFAGAVSIMIYLLYMLIPTPGPGPVPPNMHNEYAHPQILLLCFIAGVAPFQLLINIADANMSKISKEWSRRGKPGTRPVVQIEGIDSITAERLSEEGISSIHELALCNPGEIARRTKFPETYVRDWKDQSILYILSADVIVLNEMDDKKEKQYLNDILASKLGIRTISAFIDWLSPVKTDINKEASLIASMGLPKDGKNNDGIITALKIIAIQGQAMQANEKYGGDKNSKF
jgi:hypothetical protein